MSINNLMNKSAAFLSLGCKVNAYETEAIKEQFSKYGCKIVDFKEKADIYVVNTCTVTNIADRKSRQMLHKAKSENPDAFVVATGCYVQESADKLEEDGGINLLVGNRLKNKIADYVNNYIADAGSQVFKIVSNDIEEFESMTLISDYQRARVDIKIQDGCNQFCTYCIIPYARGRISSRKMNEVLEEAAGLSKKGYKEIVLTGIHISSYGFDKLSAGEKASLRTNDGSMPLVDLIEELEKIDGIERIRIGSIEPRIVNEEFAKRISNCKKLCPHFHLSLQSGCDTVLSRMNRKYSTEEYLKACEILRKYYDRPSITTDIIVGFPGETMEEFIQTKNYTRKVGFAAIHIFPYSKREGTIAAKMDGQLSNKVKQERARELAEVEKELRDTYEKSFAGEQKEILIEEIKEEAGIKYAVGHTPEYVQVAILGNESDINKMLSVTMTDTRSCGFIFAKR
jgi:threonylcarbamoyladenosine tRNA methylthiotransferase MtaB